MSDIDQGAIAGLTMLAVFWGFCAARIQDDVYFVVFAALCSLSCGGIVGVAL